MRLKLYQIDAFSSRPLAGNPAAVCPLEIWLDDATLQAIALENNLAETAFFIPHEGDYRLRWFTPKSEVDLCGHATLASAYVVFNELEPRREEVRFHTRSGALLVTRQSDRMAMDFPAWPPRRVEPPQPLLRALVRPPKEVYRSDRDFLVVYESAEDVRALDPLMDPLMLVDCLGTIATAPGDDCDFVSRFFAPRVGVPEDHVCGSAHCTLTPYWARRLGKNSMFARQISARGGEIWVELRGERLTIAGHAAKFLEGTIEV